MTNDEFEVIQEDMELIIDACRKEYNIIGFLNIVHSACSMIDCVEKQVEKFPDMTGCVPKCPVCKAEVIDMRDKDTFNYCKNCGQKIQSPRKEGEHAADK